ncbi:MAG: hypothetical protein KA035_02085 [Candidatus Levybacteria bacterium]|nr:hypothetical protein [Candidatus Levybacteria bacterium]
MPQLETSSTSRVPMEWQGGLPREEKKITDFIRSFKGIKIENIKRTYPRKQLGRSKPQK